MSNIFSVNEINCAIKDLLSQNFKLIRVRGEVTDVKYPSNGHWYITIADCNERTNCIKCTFFAPKNRFFNKIEIGQNIIVCGQVTTYAPQGIYQINIVEFVPDGIGEISKMLQHLKAKLVSEGVIGVKKRLPIFPKKVAIITSLTSAAYEDIKKTLFKRWRLSEIFVYGATMQGEQAPQSIISILNKIDNKYDCIIIARGGGSKEDLWCFNNEALARVVAKMQTPIISAVGHESDTTLIDEVSDYSSSTPTASIVDLFGDQNILLSKLDEKFQFLNFKMDNIFSSLKHHLALIKDSFVCDRLEEKYIIIETKLTKIKEKIDKIIALNSDRLTRQNIILDSEKNAANRLKNCIQIIRNGKICSLEELKSLDEVVLLSQTSQKKAIIK